MGKKKKQTKINLRDLLLPLFNVGVDQSNDGKVIYQKLYEKSRDIHIEKFIRLKDTKKYNQEKNNTKVFHYGVLVYDNYDFNSKDTLIPFKCVIAKNKKSAEAVEGLNKKLGLSQSNVHDFLYDNANNATIINSLGNDGYVVFSHEMTSAPENWEVSIVTLDANNKRVKNYNKDDMPFQGIEDLWKNDYSVLSIFRKDIMEWNGFNSGKMYTGIKVIDFDIQGRSSAYLIVNTDNILLLHAFMTLPNIQLRISLLTSSVRSLYTKIHSDLQKKEAVRSAKAAIMSRNMSHNLGSHVMFYIKQRLESVEKILKTGSLKDLVNSSSLKEMQDIVKENVSLGSEMPFLVGLGRFLNYLQERQDYIATIATDYIPSNSVVNFKDNIYDELKPDLRSKRHQGEPIGKKASNLLLDYIAYSEGFTQSDKIVLEFVYRDDNGKHYFRGDGEVPAGLRKFNVDLPGGTLGRQAFFSIMENIIRNTAKHDGAKVCGGELIFRFEELNDNNEFWDQIKKKPIKYYTGNAQNVQNAFEHCKNDYYYLGITVVLNQEESLTTKTLDNVGNALKQDYLINGQMDDTCKGIKEIRLSAAWIRGKGVDTDIPSSEPPAVAVRLDEGNLQYIICLPKPKKVAFVMAECEFEFNEKALLERGCRLFSADIIKEKTDEKGEQKDDYKFSDKLIKDFVDYELIVLDKNIGNKSRIKSLVGSRVLETENKAIKEYMREIIEPNENNTGQYNVYQKWLEVTFGKQLPKLIINDAVAFSHSADDKNKMYYDILVSEGLLESNSTDSQPKKLGQFVYSKHYSGQADLKEMYSDVLFLEGISGGNSTDRLIRRDFWSREWYVKQMTAALTQVAVFDERIFAKFVIKPNNSWTVESLKKWLEDYVKNSKEIDIDVFLDYAKKTIPVLGLNKYWYPVIDDENNTIKTDEESVKQIVLNIPSKPWDFSLANLNAQKGVYAFDIEIEKTTEKPIVIIKSYHKDENRLINVGKIYQDEMTGLYKVEYEDNCKFHFVSIHQGILDKIYGALGIKGKEHFEAKQQVTKELFNKFSKLTEKLEAESSFLPQFIIHSGRSKPNNEEMPQKQPFLQFAALDHALNDCKYTLSELLYSAHYE